MPRGIPADLTGQRFGRWTVIKRSDVKQVNGKPMWDCVCDCGTVKPVQGGNLMDSHSKGCVDCYKSNRKASSKTV